MLSVAKSLNTKNSEISAGITLSSCQYHFNLHHNLVVVELSVDSSRLNTLRFTLVISTVLLVAYEIRLTVLFLLLIPL